MLHGPQVHGGARWRRQSRTAHRRSGGEVSTSPLFLLRGADHKRPRPQQAIGATSARIGGCHLCRRDGWYTTPSYVDDNEADIFSARRMLFGEMREMERVVEPVGGRARILRHETVDCACHVAEDRLARHLDDHLAARRGNACDFRSSRRIRRCRPSPAETQSKKPSACAPLRRAGD